MSYPYTTAEEFDRYEQGIDDIKMPQGFDDEYSISTNRQTCKHCAVNLFQEQILMTLRRKTDFKSIFLEQKYFMIAGGLLPSYMCTFCGAKPIDPIPGTRDIYRCPDCEAEGLTLEKQIQRDKEYRRIHGHNYDKYQRVLEEEFGL